MTVHVQNFKVTYRPSYMVKIHAGVTNIYESVAILWSVQLFYVHSLVVLKGLLFDMVEHNIVYNSIPFDEHQDQQLSFL
jgi:hypothetical protein